MLSVVAARPEDATAIAHLMEELDRFYGGTEFEPLNERVKQVQAMLFGERTAAHVVLAKDGDRVVGLASYSFLWPAVGLTQSLYLKELYVSESHRRNGVGKLLMDRLIEIAAETGCSRVEWTADEDNLLAVGFYDASAYPRSTGKVMYRLPVQS